MKILFMLLLTIALSHALQPSKTHSVLKVVVMNFESKPYPSTEILFQGQKHGKEFSAVTNEAGDLELLLAVDDTYDILYQSLTGPYKCGEIRIPARAGRGSYTVEYDENTQTLKNVLFDTGKASLRSSSFKELDKLVKGLSENPTVRIEVAGHTDNQGGEDYNQKLSQNRAETVQNYLIKKGISKQRVTAMGYGYSQPVADNSSASGKQKNRRTEVRILSK